MGIGRQSALFDCVSVALLDFEPSFSAIAPETQIEYLLSEAQIGEQQIGEPIGQYRVNVKLAARGVRIKPEECIEQREYRSRRPGLRHIGIGILDWEIGVFTLDPGIELGHPVERKVASGIGNRSRNPRRLLRKPYCLKPIAMIPLSWGQ